MKQDSLAELIRWLRAGSSKGNLDLSADERRELADALQSKLAGGEAPARAPRSAGKAGSASMPEVKLPAEARALLHCDGASKGNPGPAALGFVVYLDGEELYSRGEALGTLTNNQAEYRALLAGLQAVFQLGFSRLDIALDSELIVRQIEGRYKVKNAGLKPLHAQAIKSLGRFADWRIRHVPRKENAAADALANEALSSL